MSNLRFRCALVVLVTVAIASGELIRRSTGNVTQAGVAKEVAVHEQAKRQSRMEHVKVLPDGDVLAEDEMNDNGLHEEEAGGAVSRTSATISMGQYCDSANRVSSFTTYSAAASSCQSTPSCIGVYDHKCDGGEYWTCGSDPVKVSTQGSCVYKKPDGETCYDASRRRIAGQGAAFRGMARRRSYRCLNWEDWVAVGALNDQACTPELCQDFCACAKVQFTAHCSCSTWMHYSQAVACADKLDHVCNTNVNQGLARACVHKVINENAQFSSTYWHGSNEWVKLDCGVLGGSLLEDQSNGTVPTSLAERAARASVSQTAANIEKLDQAVAGKCQA